MCVPGAYGNHKRMSGSQELKLQMVGSHAIGVELSHSPLQQQPMLLTTDSHSLIFATKILAHRLGKQKSVLTPHTMQKAILKDFSLMSSVESTVWDDGRAFSDASSNCGGTKPQARVSIFFWEISWLKGHHGVPMALDPCPPIFWNSPYRDKHWRAMS